MFCKCALYLAICLQVCNFTLIFWLFVIYDICYSVIFANLTDTRKTQISTMSLSSDISYRRKKDLPQLFIVKKSENF